MSKDKGAAFHLEGRILADGWVVDELVPLPPDHTGSAFSVGYKVHDGKGKKGFLKAFDLADALDAPDMTVELQRLTTLYNAERDLLRWCRGKGLSRIISPLADGEVVIEGFSLPRVPYVILEAADDDVRGAVSKGDPADQISRLRLAHHAAVAVSQLHWNGMNHRDIKPSNMVVWTGDVSKAGGTRYEGKLSDLGSAYVPGRPSPHDEHSIAGDLSYAAPEQLYHCPLRLSEARHRDAIDVFMLGNLIVYLMTGVTYNQLFYRALDDTQHWRNWGGDYEDVLPGLVDAHGLALTQFEEVLLPCLRAVRGIVDTLCHPDPYRRGDDVARRRRQNPYNLARFVTRLNLIAERAFLTGQAG